ncbi:MAG: transglycosylase domain-containing protein [Candidatus Levyibacteriota bacterium]
MQQYRSPYSRVSRLSRSKLNRTILISKLVRFGFFGLIGLTVIFFLYFLWVSRSLPTLGQLSNAGVKDSTKIIDKNGVVLYSIYKDYNRLYVPLKDIPKTLQDATISTEDKDFYTNSGFSLAGIIRGIILDPFLKGRATGGSTITQQLVKNLLLTSERSITRKVNELILAIQVNSKFSKDQILELYLNNVPYGGTAVGVEAASNLYFGKHAKDLDLAQSAFLAGLPQLPSVYSPYASTGGKAYINRTTYVLTRMREDGKITQKQADGALSEVKAFTFPERQANLKAPHFVQYIREQLAKLFGEVRVANGDLTVYTTLDYSIQDQAEKIVNEQLDKLKGLNVGNGAAIVLDPKTSGILAMVGSKNYFDTKNQGNFNAALALRQPGSSLKPIMYATALEKGYTASTVLMDVKTDFPTNDGNNTMYSPVNYDGKFRGPVQMRFALGSSLNIPAVKMLAKVGIKPVMQKAFDMGIENWSPTPDNLKSVGLSLVLGGREATLLQVTNAYSSLANRGTYVPPFGITKVTDSKGNVLYEHKSESGVKVLDEGVAFIISHILLDDNAREIAFGRYSLLNIPGKTVSVKTGTTDEKRDNWAVGYTPSYVVGVWVGNNDNSPMNPRIASGITGATPIWHDLMAAILKGKKDEQFAVPGDVSALEIDAFAGGLPVDGQAKRTEYFLKGTEPTGPSPIYKTIKVSKQDNNKLANADEISHGDYDVKTFIVFTDADPVSTDGKNRWQDAINAWVDQNYKDDPKYHPPTQTSDRKYDQNSNSNQSSNPTPTPTPTVTPTPTAGILPSIPVTPTP